MSNPRDSQPSDDEQPYVLGVSDQPAAPEVVRIEAAQPSTSNRPPPDLAAEQFRREETVRTIRNQGPEKAWTEPEKRLPAFRSIALVVLLSLIAIGGYLLAIRVINRHQAPPPLPLPASRPALSFFETATVGDIDAQTLATVRGFMEAASPSDRCRFVLGGHALQEKMRAFYERPNSPAPGRFGSILNSQDGAFGGHPIRIAFAAEDNGSVGWSFVLVGLEDRLVIDWEASVAYGQLPWSALLRDQPRQPVQMRVYLQRLPRDASHPADLILYRASARAEEEALTVAVAGESVLATQLALTIPTGASQPVNIRLSWPPPTAKTGHPRIVELIHNYWIDTARLESALQTPIPSP